MTNDDIIAFLKQCKAGHYYCEDSWYSCPLAEEGCADDRWPKNECNCGADKRNADVDAMIQKIQSERAEATQIIPPDCDADWVAIFEGTLALQQAVSERNQDKFMAAMEYLIGPQERATSAQEGK